MPEPEPIEIRAILPYAFERTAARHDVNDQGEGSLYVTPLAISGRPATRVALKLVSTGPEGVRPYELRVAKDGGLSLKYVGEQFAESSTEEQSVG
jgi:hypothetical protein